MTSETPTPSESLSDVNLVRSFVKRRSEESFLVLYRRHTPRLFQLCLRLVAWAEEEAEDVLQETWLVAAQRFGSFDWRSSLPTWLTGIMINVFREHRRRASRRNRNEVSGDQGRWNVTREEPSADPGLGLDLEEVIRQLPGGYREVLVLHDVEGYTHAEIARSLAIGVGTSKSQLFQARRKMRRLLQVGTEDKTG